MTPSITFKSHEEVKNYQGSNKNLDFIDHELSVNLDSSDAFEGPEKLLELWFYPTSDIPESSRWPKGGLRSIPLNEVEKLLDVVNCQILSKISTKEMDAYLLSESSLFVYANKMILKTCGTTTTLSCFDKLIELVNRYLDDSFSLASFKSIYRVFYSRRTFMFPHKQLPVYRNWNSELELLHRYFPAERHRSYIFGDDTKNNWHLYINGDNNDRTIDEDITIELLMTDLDESRCAEIQISNHEDVRGELEKDADLGHVLGERMMRQFGLDKIFGHEDGLVASYKHDAFAFTPCGYSSNSILNLNNYYTFHITPEKGSSYASFETNYSPSCRESYLDLIAKILDAIKPGSFTLVVCYNKHKSGKATADNIESFHLSEQVLNRRFECIHNANIDVGYNYNVACSVYNANNTDRTASPQQ